MPLRPPGLLARLAARGEARLSARRQRTGLPRGASDGDAFLPISGGGCIRYREAGRGAPVVLLPDPPNSVEHYADLMGRLAPRRRVLVLDPPGFGRSLPPRGFGFQWTELAAGTAEALDRLGVRSATLSVGCLGGFVGIQLAVERPDLVRRLVLAQVPGPEAMLAWVRAGHWWLFGTPVVGQLVTAFLARQVAASWYGSCLGPATPVEPFRAPALALLAAGGAFPLASAFQMFRPGGAFPAEGAPDVTLVWGAADATHAATDRRSLLERLPGSTYVEFAEAGHYPDLEQPERYAAILAAD